MVNGLLPHAIYQLGQAAVVLTISFLVRLLCWSLFTHLLSAPHVLCGGGDPMTASLFNSFITCFRATHLLHMRSEQRWRLNLKCSTATEPTAVCLVVDALHQELP